MRLERRQIAEQYEVAGPIAFDGLGRVHLATDRAMSRWLVLMLKGGGREVQALPVRAKATESAAGDWHADLGVPLLRSRPRLQDAGSMAGSTSWATSFGDGWTELAEVKTKQADELAAPAEIKAAVRRSGGEQAAVRRSGGEQAAAR